jgi:hypothetical protein
MGRGEYRGVVQATRRSFKFGVVDGGGGRVLKMYEGIIECRSAAASYKDEDEEDGEGGWEMSKG